jgi:uncharacterized protein
MAQANVEVVRQLYARLPTHADSELDEFLEMLAPDVVWDVSRRTFDAGVYHGREEVKDFLTRLVDIWESGRIEPTEFMATGDDVVVVPVRLHLVSRTHGKTMTANAAHVWTLREGKIIRHCGFQTKADALAAVGLPG